MWQRSDNQNQFNRRDYWDNDCESKAYFTPFVGQSPINNVYFQLPNGQEVRIFSNRQAVAFTSAQETVVHLMNLSNSWIDVMLEDRYLITPDPPADPYWTNWEFENEWRSYGDPTPDIWDGAPWHLKDNYSNWPPQDTETHQYRTILCDHSKSQGCNAYTQNADDVDDIYRTSNTGLLETALIPIKGLWSGLIYADVSASYNEPACDVISMSLRKLRIENQETHHRMWVSFGGEHDFPSSPIIDAIDYYNAWDTAEYSYVVDILLDRTLQEVDWGKNITWPTFDDETVVFDTELNIQKPGFLFLPESPFDIMGPAGINEIFRITDEHKENFKQYGFTDSYINWSYAQPLVKKPLVIDE